MAIFKEFQLQDEEGNVHDATTTIPVYSDPTLDHPGRKRTGLPEHQLNDGMALNENKDGTFTVVQTGKILRKV
jgi:hypothetical protein